MFIPPGRRDAALRGREGASPTRPGFPIRGLRGARACILQPVPAALILSRLLNPLVLWVCVRTHRQHLSRVLHMRPFLSALPLPARGWSPTGFGMGISTTFMPWHFLVSVGHRDFWGYAVAALMVCGGTVPWSGVLPVLLCLDTHCSALTPGDKE